jgi:hypothetical protein
MEQISKAIELIKKSGLNPELEELVSTVCGKIEHADVQPKGFTKTAGINPDSGNIQLFKNFESGTNSLQELLGTIGELLLAKSGADGKAIWEKKLVLLTSNTPEKFNGKLKSKQFSSFRSLVESFKGSVNRLEALHIANALIYHKISFGDSFNLDVKVWPQTEAFCNGKKPYSLIPLATAYFDQQYMEFSNAFCGKVLGDIKCSRKDVLDKFLEVVDGVLAAAGSK